MKQLVKEIERLGRVLVFLWMENGMSNDEAQEAVLVVLKEHLDPNDKSTFNKENLNECIMTLKGLVK
jgi:hypothetical protein